MPGKLNLYALGQGGVNVVKSPIQLLDTECRSAQNAIYAPEAEGGLQKRGGLTRFNTSALNSGASILSIVNVPLPLPGAFTTASEVRQYLYLGWAEVDNWIRSSDGTTWVDASEPNLPGSFQLNGLPELGLPPIQPVSGLLLYISPNTSLDDFWVYDGSSDELVLVVPPAVSTTPAYSAGASGYHNGAFYFGTLDPPDARVYKFDLITGQLTMIIGQLGVGGYTAFSIVSYLGSLFVGVSDNAAGVSPESYVYRCNPDIDTAWTVDSAALDGVPSSMVNFQGNLYIATGSRRVADDMKIYKRTPSGVYSTVFTDASPWNVLQGGQLVVFDNKLFAYVAGNILSSSNGTAWAVELDVFTTYASLNARCGRPVVFRNALYWAFRDATSDVNGRLLRRAAGGGWSSVYGPADIYANLTIFEVP